MSSWASTGRSPAFLGPEGRLRRHAVFHEVSGHPVVFAAGEITSTLFAEEVAVELLRARLRRRSR